MENFIRGFSNHDSSSLRLRSSFMRLRRNFRFEIEISSMQPALSRRLCDGGRSFFVGAWQEPSCRGIFVRASL